jgi:uncharacterized protein YndB with AHSA1/START domain
MDRSAAGARRREWQGRVARDHRRQGRAVGVVRPERLAGRLAIDRPVRTMSLDLQAPIPNDPERHRASRHFADRVFL